MLLPFSSTWTRTPAYERDFNYTRGERGNSCVMSKLIFIEAALFSVMQQLSLACESAAAVGRGE